MCTNCNSANSYYLGLLGQIVWLRCRDCGTTFEGNLNTYPQGRID